MPAFSFEKIAPPAPHTPATPSPRKINEQTNEQADQKQRGVIVQVLNRIAVARGKRNPKDRPASGAEQNRR